MKGDFPTHAFGAGRYRRYDEFDSQYVAARRIEVWLPPGYDDDNRRYPVVYAQDGQNLFDAATAYVGVDWALQEAATRLAEEQDLSAILVGIWNTPERIPEYMPQKPLQIARNGRIRKRFIERYGSAPISDDYLRFLVSELKPEIDAAFRTDPHPSATTLLGSSMGALLSLYGFCEYPGVFGNAVCMSTSWTIGGKPMIAYLRGHTPPAANNRIYFDYGSEAQIGAYEKLQHEVDRLFYDCGYRRDINLMVQRFPGDPHSEVAWRDRVEVPLRFVLGRR